MGLQWESTMTRVHNNTQREWLWFCKDTLLEGESTMTRVHNDTQVEEGYVFVMVSPQ